MVSTEVFLSLPGGYLLNMMAPLNLAKLEEFVASNSAGKLENLNWLLLVGQIVIQLNTFQWHCISQQYAIHLRVTLL